jgi:26S proteasome regulatory subunit N5
VLLFCFSRRRRRHRSAVQLLLKKEIINYPVPGQDELEASPMFTDDGLAEHWHGVLRQRITQHNIRIAALYYKRIKMTRLAQLLGLDVKQLETEIAAMVSNGTVYAKIDRPADIIRFEQKKSSEAVLTSWADNIDKLLHLVETTTHLIHKERKINAK